MSKRSYVLIFKNINLVLISKTNEEYDKIQKKNTTGTDI